MQNRINKNISFVFDVTKRAITECERILFTHYAEISIWKQEIALFPLPFLILQQWIKLLLPLKSDHDVVYNVVDVSTTANNINMINKLLIFCHDIRINLLKKNQKLIKTTENDKQFFISNWTTKTEKEEKIISSSKNTFFIHNKNQIAYFNGLAVSLHERMKNRLQKIKPELCW